MTRSKCPERPPPAPRGRRAFSLIETIICVVLLGGCLVPLVGIVQKQHKRSKTSVRLAIAESLVRDEIEYLNWQRRSNGFGWLVGQAGTYVSGTSNPGGTGNNGGANPRIDDHYNAPITNEDTTRDCFDRRVSIRILTLRMKDPADTVPPYNNPLSFRVAEVVVTVINPLDSLMNRNPTGVDFYRVVTYIGDHP